MTVRLEVCHSCREKAVVALLDCGPQPVGHRFLTSAGQEEGLFPLVVSQCRACGLIQLSHPAPVDEIRPRFDWISYNEPDAHLDALVEALSKLPGLLRESHVGAVVVGGDKTIECFQQRGFANIWRIDLQRDLDVCEPNSGTETLQARLTPEAAARITHEQGLFDLLVVRHMVEHAHEARSFLAAIQQMLKPGGYAIFEVPDCSRAFDACDYSILWEEHVFYFMPFTFRHCLETAGFQVLDLQQPTYSLVALTRKESVQAQKLHADILKTEIDRMQHFSESLPRIRKATQECVSSLHTENGPVAFFGAGHMACTYINLLELHQELDCVVDDHPQKRGLLMPGSHLPIIGSDSLAERGVKVCLSALSPESEAKVIRNNPHFTAAGGKFLSIFAGRPNFMPIRSCA
ncbi:MAG TPA: hypothetical protein DDZ88_00080 [Verrucomicrobiales bacterium]|nr:hypothetical protein [Verrucomicrobiales bacterium]